MELITSLKEKNPNEMYRSFEGVEIGNYVLSIQGSMGHYCTPRKNVPVDEYTTMEIAIWRNDGEKFLCCNKSSTMRAFNRYDELMERAEGSQPTVFGYVPVDLIEELGEYLNNPKLTI